jgi:hypothetical protein
MSSSSSSVTETLATRSAIGTSTVASRDLSSGVYVAHSATRNELLYERLCGSPADPSHRSSPPRQGLRRLMGCRRTRHQTPFPGRSVSTTWVELVAVPMKDLSRGYEPNALTAAAITSPLALLNAALARPPGMPISRSWVSAGSAGILYGDGDSGSSELRSGI